MLSLQALQEEQWGYRPAAGMENTQAYGVWQRGIATIPVQDPESMVSP